MRHAWVLLLLTVLSLLGRPALGAPGAEPARRVLLVAREPDPFLERVGAEVAGLGFVLVRSQLTGALEDVARTESAVAAIRVLPSRQGVEVWMSDAISGRSLLRQIIVDESVQGPNQGLVALQTAELLRTSFFSEPARDPEPASRSVSPRSPVKEAAPSKPQLDAGVQAALGVLYSPGGGNAALQVGLSLHHSLSARLGLALDLSAPLRSASVSGLEGSASIGTYLAGVGLFTRLSGPKTPFFATAGVSAALALITSEGDTRAPFVADSESAFTAAAYLRGEAGLEPISWLRIGFRGLAGASATRVQVHFAGNDAGSWGRTFVAAFVLAEVPWH